MFGWLQGWWNCILGVLREEEVERKSQLLGRLTRNSSLVASEGVLDVGAGFPTHWGTQAFVCALRR